MCVCFLLFIILYLYTVSSSMKYLELGKSWKFIVHFQFIVEENLHCYFEKVRVTSRTAVLAKGSLGLSDN